MICLLLPSLLSAQVSAPTRRRPAHLTSTLEGVIFDDSTNHAKNSRTRRIVVGVSIGAVVGAVMGYAIESKTCRPCDDRFPALAAGLAGAVVGGAVGAMIAYPEGQSRSTSHASARGPVVLPIGIGVSITLR